MEQPLSKGSTKSLNKSKLHIHHKREKEMIFTEVKEHDDEEDLIQSPEDSDEDGDLTNVKESAPAKRNRLQSMDENEKETAQLLNLDYKNRSRDKSANILPKAGADLQQKQYQSAQEAEMKLPQKISKPRLERNSEQMSPTGPAMMYNNSQLIPPQLLYQNQQPLNPYQQPYYGAQGQLPLYPPSAFPGHSQFENPYAAFPPMFHPSQMQSPLLAGGGLQDNDSMFNFDDFPSYLGQQQLQQMQRIPHSDLSSMFADHSTGPAEILQMQQSDEQKQWAIVMEDVQSIPQNRGTTRASEQLMQLYEGDKVEVLKIFDNQSAHPQNQRSSNISLVECKFENLIGLFPLSALKLLKRPTTNQQSTFHKQHSMPPDSQQRAQQQMMLQRTTSSPSPIPPLNQQQQFFQYQQAYNQQLQQQHQLQEKKSKLKLNERKKQKMSRE